MLTYYTRRPRRMGWPNAAWMAGYSGGSRMPVDIRESDEGYEIMAAVPGLKAEDVEIQVLEDVITLRVKASPEAAEEKDLLLNEIRGGTAERSFRLPAPVDPESAEASVEDGLLRLTLPKAEIVRPKTIAIKSN